MSDANALRRELDACREAGIQNLLSVLRLIESIPDADLTPELRQWQEEQRATIREDLMKITGDSDGRQLRARIDDFLREMQTYPKAG